jgi:hypothetical protein
LAKKSNVRKVSQRPAKGARKRSKTATNSPRPSTTRSTAGPGFDFEDRVAAWLLLKTLTGEPLPAIGGAAVRLQMQVEALGWEIDDILLTAETADGQRRLAISCKGNVQVTAQALPPDFVVRCWRQWAKPDPNPMVWGKDRLALVTRGTKSAFMATWSDLKNAAPDTDLSLALGRMRATGKHRAVFDSVRRPPEDAGIAVSDAEAVAMVNAMAVIPLDFHIADSESERQAIARARTLLTNGSLREGTRLWIELVAQATQARLGSGTIEVADLWRLLRGKFALKNHPDFEASWQRLRALTADYKVTIETDLHDGLTLDRKIEASELLAALSTDTACAVFGDSGSGKSALVKLTLDREFPDAAQVWLGPDYLDLVLSEATRAGLGLDQPLTHLLNATPHRQNFLVIDAAERLNQACMMKTKALIAALAAGNAQDATPVWRVVIVAQTDAWVSGKVQELTGSSAPVNYSVKALPEDTVRQTLRGFGGLGWLATQADAVQVLTNVRTLAWVVQAAARFQDGGDGLSLTVIADRLWHHWTDNKPTIQRLLLRLAEREASFEHSFALSELEGGDAAVLDNLPITCPLRTDTTTGRIQFAHDLAADWARFQRLKEIQGDTARWTPLAANPFWHGALRMLGQLLLRQPAGPRSAWDIAFEVAEKNRLAVPLADDILLDALFVRKCCSKTMANAYCGWSAGLSMWRPYRAIVLRCLIGFMTSACTWRRSSGRRSLAGGRRWRAF